LDLDGPNGSVIRKLNLEKNMQAKLAGTRYGRIMLHVVCALRDHQVRWHWRGIHRELVRRTA
jgi:hypothetical protein